MIIIYECSYYENSLIIIAAKALNYYTVIDLQSQFFSMQGH